MNQIQSSGWQEGFSHQELSRDMDEAIEHLLRFCKTHRYPARTEFIHPGDPERYLYYILKGSVSIVTEDEQGHELILAYLNEGEFIGEVGVFYQQMQRGVTVRTRTPCELAQISYERINRLFHQQLKEEYPLILFAMGAQLSQRLLNTNRKLHQQAFMDVSHRVARTLLDLCHEPDAMSHPQGTQLRITRQEISRLAGCSREVAGRVLKRMEQQGLVEVSGKTIVVFHRRPLHSSSDLSLLEEMEPPLEEK